MKKDIENLTDDTKNRILNYHPKVLMWKNLKKEETLRRKKERELKQSMLPKSKRKKPGRKKIEDPKVMFPAFRVNKSLMNELLDKYSKSELRIKAVELMGSL